MIRLPGGGGGGCGLGGKPAGRGGNTKNGYWLLMATNDYLEVAAVVVALEGSWLVEEATPKMATGY